MLRTTPDESKCIVADTSELPGPDRTQNSTKLSPGEMSTLVSYLWADQFFASSGVSARGRKVFRQKSCAGCHEGGQAKRLAGSFSAVRLTSALWSHGPTMLERLTQQSTSWPQVLQSLAKAGLVTAQLGRGGGFILTPSTCQNQCA